MKLEDLKTEEEKEQLDEISKIVGTAAGGYAGYTLGSIGGFVAGAGLPGAFAGALAGGAVGAKLGRMLANGTKGEELDKYNKIMRKRERDLKRLETKFNNAKDDMSKERIQNKIESTVKYYDDLLIKLAKEFEKAK